MKKEAEAAINAVEPGQDSAPAANDEAISRRAYELWQQRGCPSGCPQEDWFRAEQELLGSEAAVAPQK